MLKIVSLLNVLPKNVCDQSLRGFKTKGEYFKRFGYKYTDHFKGGIHFYLIFLIKVNNLRSNLKK